MVSGSEPLWSGTQITANMEPEPSVFSAYLCHLLWAPQCMINRNLNIHPCSLTCRLQTIVLFFSCECGIINGWVKPALKYYNTSLGFRAQSFPNHLGRPTYPGDIWVNVGGYQAVHIQRFKNSIKFYSWTILNLPWHFSIFMKLHDSNIEFITPFKWEDIILVVVIILSYLANLEWKICN